MQVSIFEPNHFKTPMAERLITGLERTFAALPDETKEKYGEDYFTARCGVQCYAVAVGPCAGFRRLLVAQALRVWLCAELPP